MSKAFFILLRLKDQYIRALLFANPSKGPHTSLSRAEKAALWGIGHQPHVVASHTYQPSGLNKQILVQLSVESTRRMLD